MNIQDRFFCSRCLSPLPSDEETICPHCGHDPDETYALHLLEEGTLLHHRRYHIGVIQKETTPYCWYGAWDCCNAIPVLIQEFYPRHLIRRNILVSDLPVCHSGKEAVYQTALRQFLSVPSAVLVGYDQTDRFEDTGFGYAVYTAERYRQQKGGLYSDVY